MYKLTTGILIPILVIALIGTGYWGYQENQEKNSILIKAENQYQKAFHDLNYHIDVLNDELGKALAVNTRNQLSPSLINVWRLSYSAQSDLSQLPLVLMPFSKTEEFLAKVADFSYRIAVRDLEQDPLTDSEYNTLKNLYKNSKDIQKELHDVQTNVIDKQLRWMDVELALALEDKQMDNTIIDGFKTIDKKVEEFPETDWGPGIANLEKKNQEKAKNLSGENITEEQAKKKAISFLGLSDSSKLKVEEAGKGLDYKAYSVTVEQKNKIYLDITKKGGHVVWMMINREVKAKKLTLDQAIDKAESFLKKHKYTSMEPIHYEEYDNTLILTFAYKENNTIVYPDIVSLKVALDNGEIIGLQTTDYIFNHKPRTIPNPKMTEDEVKTKVNPNLKILSIKMALIENDDGEEVLTYEITGQMDDNSYKIYINAENGNEEEIQKVIEDGKDI